MLLCYQNYLQSLFSEERVNELLQRYYSIVSVHFIKTLNPLSANLQNGQSHSNNSSNCLSVFNHFVGLALKGLRIHALNFLLFFNHQIALVHGQKYVDIRRRQLSFLFYEQSGELFQVGRSDGPNFRGRHI